ncbi:MAG: porin family protein [Saprospiraceae bacterium]
MNKIYFILGLFLFCNINVNAQLGVRAGLNFASVSAENGGVTLNSDSKLGFHFGLVNDFKLSDNLTFRPGILYSVKGSKLTLDIFGVNETITDEYTYLDVPLHFVYNFTGEEKGFFAEAGPYLAFLLSAKSQDEDVKDLLKSLDFGLNFGLGYDLGNFIIGANYSFGLSNIADGEDSEDVNVKNKNIAVYGVYQF